MGTGDHPAENRHHGRPPEHGRRQHPGGEPHRLPRGKGHGAGARRATGGAGPAHHCGGHGKGCAGAAHGSIRPGGNRGQELPQLPGGAFYL